MEKYSQFADKATGVNPFVPQWISREKSSRWRGSWLLGSSLLPIRLAGVAVSAFWLAVIELLMLQPLAILYPPLARKVGLRIAAAPLRCLLFFIGIHKISLNIADDRRLRVKSEPGPQLNAYRYLREIRGGDLVLANCTSAIDILLAQYLLRPAFAQLYVDGTLDHGGVLAAFAQTCAHKPLHSTLFGGGRFGELPKLRQSCLTSRDAPLFIFPEGGKSNGAAILPWKVDLLLGRLERFNTNISPALENEPPPSVDSAVLFTFQYPNAKRHLSPPHTAFTALYHFFCLLMEPSHPVVVTVTTKRQTSLVLQRDENEPPQPPDVLLRRLREAQGRSAAGLELVNVPVERQSEFASYYRETVRSGYLSSAAGPKPHEG